MKISHINKFLEVGAVLNFLGLICVVFLQVFSRFLLPKAPSWTEELSRILFIYAISFAAPLALLRNEYVRVDILVGKLPEKIQKAIEIIIYIILTIFSGIIAYSGVQFSLLGRYQTSPAMGFTMMYSYIAIGFSGMFLTLFSLIIIRRKMKEIREPAEINQENDNVELEVQECNF